MSEAMARGHTPHGGAAPAPRRPGARAIDAVVLLACWAAVSGIALAALPPAASSRSWAVLAPVVGAVWAAALLGALRRSRARQATRVVQVCVPAALATVLWLLVGAVAFSLSTGGVARLSELVDDVIFVLLIASVFGVPVLVWALGALAALVLTRRTAPRDPEARYW